MTRTKEELWERFQKYYSEFPGINLSMDLSRVDFPDNYFSTVQPRMQKAFADMAILEGGAIANPDEKRMVGHYWLRNSVLAPNEKIRKEIDDTVAQVKTFAENVHNGTIQGDRGRFKHILLIGIGGSALGPQFVSHALSNPANDKMDIYFFDNTDPDGMDRVLAKLATELGQTLCIVISKSGGTKETRNGMLEAQAAYYRAGLEFGQHAIAVTGCDSDLARWATENRWLASFPMWDWVGGRTSETSAVGLLPAALQGFDIDGLLSGAKACDDITRIADLNKNPAAQLSCLWDYLANVKGVKDMVVLPYKDRLELFSRYLQQLVMESLGKEKDLKGHVVNQGIGVYGNKGSTDQHAYVQQLVDGLNNFFVTFIEVLQDRASAQPPLFVEDNITSGDYLNGFLQGNRQALYDKERLSITITVNEVSAFSVGVLIALFERAVGFYASLVNINAYHQPGVEAGKKAAGGTLAIQVQILNFLRLRRNPATLQEIANGINCSDVETVFRVCRHLSVNPEHKLKKLAGNSPFSATYQLVLT